MEKRTIQLDYRRPPTEHLAVRPTPAWRTVGALLFLAIAAILLFARLGHYALWDDEAYTALGGEGVWLTGDTSVLLGHNILAPQRVCMLSGFKNRYEPPLEEYTVALFAGIWPGSALAVRMPFAILGFLTVGLVLWWMRRDNVSTITWVLVTMGLVANVSFWLYCRQCRYYALIIFLSLAIAYLYLHYENRWWVPGLIGLASAGLFASNYMAYAGLYAMIGVDWLIWGRKQFRPGWRGWLWIWAPQILANVPIFVIWFPFGKPDSLAALGRLYVNRFALFLFYFRDLDTCQFGVILLVCAAPLLWLWRRNPWLVRAPLAALAYIAVVSLTSPQPMWAITPTGQWLHLVSHADVRYISPLIPLFIVIAAMVIKNIVPARWTWLAIPIAAVAFFTDAMHVGPSFEPIPPYDHWSAQSTPLDYAQELLDPPTDPYSVASAWINANVKEGQSVFVLPDYRCYPLMFHAPQAIYAWQFAPEKRAEYPTLPEIDFRNGGVPDYLVVFGRGAPPAERIHLPNHHVYEMVRMFDVYGHDLFRPELFLRTFQPITGFDPLVDGVKIYKNIGTDRTAG